MDFIAIGISLLFGIFMGWLLGNRKSGVPKVEFELLLKQEAGAQEKIKGLLEDTKVKQESLSKGQDEIIKLNRDLAQLQATAPQLERNFAEMKQDRDSLKNSTQELAEKLSSITVKANSIEIEKQLLSQQLATLKGFVDDVKKQTKMEFENLANQVLDAKTKTFSETTEKSLDVLLKPLKEKIQNFEKAVDEKYSNEAKERHALKSEIEKLITLNDKMAVEAHSLTQALRGDSKIQGDWGELVLAKILEASGLQEGLEYSQQKSHNDDEGDRFRPDIIINLPENKHVIVDSKVSLKAYDLYRSSEDEGIQSKVLGDHIKSIENHINDLGDKHYSKLKGVHSPELVFMFVPIEPAYLLAMQKDSDLSARAWKKGVAIVTSTTLLTSLKTVASIWRLEKQNKNAMQIAQEGAKLYDKFVGFLEDFEKIGKTFDNGQKQYSDAMSKLRDGSGSVFKKMELLRELGAAPKNKIKTELLE